MNWSRLHFLAGHKTAALNLLLLILVAALLKDTIRPIDSFLYKLGAGFVMGTYGAFGKEVAKKLIVLIRAKRLDVIDSNIWTRPVTLLGLVLLMVAGVISWLVGWEGQTGSFYGFGVLLGILLFDFGIGKTIAAEYAIPEAKSCDPGGAAR